MIKETVKKQAAKKFAKKWEGRGDEKSDTQSFWIELLGDVYGAEDLSDFIRFEQRVKLEHVSFIDAVIPSTKVMIEQKSIGKNLNAPIRQSDGSLLTPLQQAKRYVIELPVSEHPRWLVTCNFEEFRVYDMERPNAEAEIIKLKDLETEYYRLNFLVDQKDENTKKELEVSKQAGDLVGLIYDALLKQYADPESEETLKSLNMLCVRLVFCLYAEDAGIFGSHGMFYSYLKEIADKSVSGVRRGLVDLFRVLDTPEDERDKYLADDNPKLAAFPYVNGGLFADDDIEIPPFTDEIVDLLLNKASADFDWSEISPTIFGAVFESTLNPETRRSGGMHYTSIENIHKVIDPLFLDDLKEEFEDIKRISVEKKRKSELDRFQEKLAGLTFLDPACGSGNFLTETYLSIRRIENEVIRIKHMDQIQFETGDVIKVSIGQFYGIEINDFAVSVAKAALWIAESQMMIETAEIIYQNIEFLPLKTNANIVEGNALRIDWEDVVPKSELNYIMGNPPFVGMAWMSRDQKSQLVDLFTGNKKAGTLDYVSGWYIKAIQLMQGTNINAAFVSTNSICQGEQIGAFWKYLFDHYSIDIGFAYRSFRWDSEASIKAHVYCVIVGFSACKWNRKKIIFLENNVYKICKNINAYLVDGENIFVERRSKPICNVPPIHRGNQPTDGGNLIIEADEYEEFVKKEPQAEKYIKQYMMGYEFINNKKRYCLWLVNVSPSELKSMPLVMKRIQKVKEMREASSFEPTRKMAATPTLFREQFNPENLIAIPKVSSSERKYVPMGYLTSDVILGDMLFMIENGSKYHFGVLTSNVHMAWMRAVCGRLGTGYRYSKDIVYNNFPWPDPTDEQKARIEQTAQAILDARDLYPDSSLADLYDDLTMPPELRRAHQDNDRAVMAAYGFPVKDFTESDCVAELMKMYQELVSKTENKKR